MNMFDAQNILLLISSTLLLSYISTLFYSKTKIPDIIWVLGFGVLLGPVWGFFDKELFLKLSPLMSILALSIILFEAGLTVDITQLIKGLTKASVLSIFTILSVIFAVGYALSYFMPSSFTLLEGMLLGAMIGGTSTIAVYGVLSDLIRILPGTEGVRILLLLESVVSDPICIISSVTLIQMIMTPGVSLRDSIIHILFTFVVSSLFGSLLGIMWSEVLGKLRGRPLNYVITLAVLFPAYIIAEEVVGEGGGPMAALTFGLMIANYNSISRRIGLSRNLKIDMNHLRAFHEETTFFIKAFFFVYIGLIVTITAEYVQIGLGILALIMFTRFIVVNIVGRVLNFTELERALSILIYASGLPAFVMSQLPLIFDPQKQYFLNPEIYPNLVMPIVLGTILIAALSGPSIAKRVLKS
jgi:cell volume regulation protein A